jgi:hypothetical protein
MDGDSVGGRARAGDLEPQHRPQPLWQFTTTGATYGTTGRAARGEDITRTGPEQANVGGAVASHAGGVRCLHGTACGARADTRLAGRPTWPAGLQADG